jgi:putative aldouronate transport system permease protein
MLQSRGRIGQDNPFREELADVSVMLMQDKLKWTALFVSIVPMLLAYPFIQKYFAKGVMIGALKD